MPTNNNTTAPLVDVETTGDEVTATAQAIKSSADVLGSAAKAYAAADKHDTTGRVARVKALSKLTESDSLRSVARMIQRERARLAYTTAGKLTVSEDDLAMLAESDAFTVSPQTVLNHAATGRYIVGHGGTVNADTVAAVFRVATRAGGADALTKAAVQIAARADEADRNAVIVSEARTAYTALAEGKRAAKETARAKAAAETDGQPSSMLDDKVSNPAATTEVAPAEVTPASPEVVAATLTAAVGVAHTWTTEQRAALAEQLTSALAMLAEIESEVAIVA